MGLYTKKLWAEAQMLQKFSSWQELKMQDWKKLDQISGNEKEGLETAGPFDAGWKMRDKEKKDQYIIVEKVEIGKHVMENAGLENALWFV